MNDINSSTGLPMSGGEIDAGVQPYNENYFSNSPRILIMEQANLVPVNSTILLITVSEKLILF